jgi:hypothetical protein
MFPSSFPHGTQGHYRHPALLTSLSWLLRYKMKIGTNLGEHDNIVEYDAAIFVYFSGSQLLGLIYE